MVLVIHGKSFLQILDKLFDTATKTELDPVKTASKEVVYKTEVTVELIGNKTDEKKKMKSKHMRYGFNTCWRNNYFTREKTTNIK